MRAAIVIDDPLSLNFLLEKLGDYSKVEDCFGMQHYECVYRNCSFDIFFLKDNENYMDLRVEDLFVFGCFDILVNMQYCYLLDRNFFNPGDLVFLKNVKCDSDCRSMIGELNSSDKCYSLDTKINEKIISVSQEQNIHVFPANCFSSASLFNRRSTKTQHLAPLVDLKSFSLYEISFNHNKNMVCFGVVKDVNVFRCSELLFDNLNKLSFFCLEFICKCFQ